MILTAHEASHHFQFESESLEGVTQERVFAAVFSTVKDSMVADAWQAWCRELFADALSLLLVGPAAIWAVEELEMRPQAALRISPSVTYPPPLVRLALLRAMAKEVGIAIPEQPSCDVAAAADEEDDDIRQLLMSVDTVAAALVGLELEPGQTLRTVARTTVHAYSTYGSVAAWRTELLGPDEPLPQRSLDAARFCVAAGVDAWQRFGSHDETAELLAVRLRAVLPECREPGTRAADAVPDAESITRDLARDLYVHDFEEFPYQ
jgi:hypothetical protein